MKTILDQIKEILKDYCEIKKIEFTYCSNLTLPDGSNAVQAKDLEIRHIPEIGDKFFLKNGKFLTFSEAAIIELIYKNKTYKIWSYLNPDDSTLELDLLKVFSSYVLKK